MREPIAIVGMACRFPGQVTDTNKLWDMLMEPRSAYSQVPAERFRESAFYHPDSKNNGTFHTQGGHFLSEDISRFDAAFFSITPAEAKAMDPQLRLMLEVSYEAFENGGFTLNRLKGSNTSVYTALYNRDYEKMLLRDPENLPFYTTTGNGEAMYSNRLSYFFDLKGPSFSLDTGCSGGMVALHNACSSIWAGESQQSLVAAANLALDPATMIGPSFMQFFSKDGHSYSFDSRACGYGRGEGVACVVLKSLSEALKDGDNIRSLIRSSVTNQDGRTLGITMPDLNAQKHLIEKAYSMAEADPRDTVYVETHGSGTVAGDTVESTALGTILGRGRHRYDPLVIGSIKTNIGHLENVSGLAALLKAVLIIEKGCIPPSLNFNEPNPGIDFNRLNLKVSAAALPLSHTESRQVSVSSFGYGGTNCHVVLDKHPTERHIGAVKTSAPSAEEFPSWYLFPLSARSKDSSSLLAIQLRDYMEKSLSHQEIFSSLAHTLCHKRSHFQWRGAVVAGSASDLKKSCIDDLSFSHSSTAPALGFVFTGQGSQWHGMGQELLETSSVFKDSIFAAERYLISLGAEWRLTEELLKNPETSLLNNADVAQPACTAIQLGLVNLLSSWNIRPYAVIGHSSGEIAAAYACNVISFEDALQIAYSRGYCAAKLTKENNVRGAMLAVGISEKNVRTYLDRLDHTFGTVSIACINSPQSVTLSGDVQVIERLHELFQRDGVFVRRFPVEVAYHSHHMRQVAPDYKNALARISRPDASSRASFFSTVDGQLIHPGSLNADYWVKNLVSPVVFSQAFEQFCQALSSSGTEKRIIIEIGPHSALKGPIKQSLVAFSPGNTGFEYVSLLVRNKSARRTSLAAAGELFCHGCDINLDAVNLDESRGTPQILADLPPYPWDHSTSFWHESRLSHNYRKRQDAPHALLGVLAPDSSILEPRWRKYISLTEMPWLAGHKVWSRVVFPGAGYLCMALDAGAWYATQTGLGADEVSSITLSDVSFTQALILPESDESVETIFVLKPAGTQMGRDLAGRHEFLVYSSPDGVNVMEHCRGFIAILTKGANCNFESPSVDAEERSNMSIVHPTKVYDGMKRLGLDYSGCFAGLSSVAVGAASSRSIVDASKPEHYSAKLLGISCLHPATLDACIQSVFPAITENSSSTGSFLLSSVKEVTLWAMPSKDHFDAPNTYHVNCRVSRQGRSYTSRLDIAPGERASLTMSISSLIVAEIEAAPQSVASRESTRCQKLVKIVDPSFMNARDIEKLCLAPMEDASISHQLALYNRACQIFATATLEQLLDRDLQRLEAFQVEYVKWLKGVAAQAVVKQCLDPEHDAELLQVVEKDGVVGQMICRIGKNLPQILKGEVQALSLMMEGGLLHSVYREDVGIQRCATQAAEYAHLLGLKNPNLRILEVGAGTGGATLPIIEALSGTQRNLFHHYDFTDISRGFFSKATDKFAKWKDQMSFQTLNIEMSPESQGFDEGAYDLVIAANVLHATTKIDQTMKHVRSLLKPGGCLLLVESTQPTAHRSFIFGTLPGWWLGSTERKKDHPLLTVEEWHPLLQETGFGGVESCTHAYNTPGEHLDSLIVSLAKREQRDTTKDSMLVVVSESQLHGTDGGLGLKGAQAIAHSLSIHEDRIVCLGNPKIRGQMCICLAGLEESILATCSEAEFTAIKYTLSHAREVVWVTRGATDDCPNPKAGLAIGLLRVLRRENPEVRFVSVDLDSCVVQSPLQLATSLRHFIQREQLSHDGDREWIERNGQWFVPRLIDDDSMTEALSSDNCSTSNSALRTEQFLQADRSLRLAVGQSQTLHDLHFVDDTSLLQPMAGDEIEIDVRASGINFRDSLIALGLLNTQSFLGECSGVVTHVGIQWKDQFKPGDRVYTSYVTAYANRVRAKGSLTHLIPRTFSFEDAAALPFIFGTAYYSLIDIARLQKGESVLIHAGAGGVGQAAITLAQHIGAVVYTTVGTEEKKQHLMKRYGLPESRIFFSRNADFANAIQKVTNNTGVDVVLNSFAGPLLQASMNVLARFGRFVELGKMDATSCARMDMSVFTRAISITAVDLSLLMTHQPKVVAALHENVHRLIKAGIFAPPPISVYPVSQIENAFRHIQAGKQIGKLVLSYHSDHLVKVAPRALMSSQLRSDGTYLVIGGQGGLGQKICSWMALNGAKHIVILSPSGATKDAIRTLIKELAESGTELQAISCDVSNDEQLLSALTVCRHELPPIQGVIYAAVSLRDTVFETMTWQDYRHVLRCKMVGLYQLHQALLEQPLNFFVILSSYSGLIGNPGQSNYAAASTFQDAFARWRTSQGLPTTSIDLGVIQGAGYVHENPAATENLRKSGLEGVPVDALLALLKNIIFSPPEAAHSSQIAIGWGHGTAESVDRSLFSHLFSPQAEMSNGDDDLQVNPDKLLYSALHFPGSSVEAVAQFEIAICQYVSGVLGVPIEDVNPLKSMSRHGGDSLVVVEFRTWLQKGVGGPLGRGKDLGQLPLRELAQLAASCYGKQSTKATIAPQKKPSHHQPKHLPDKLRVSDDAVASSSAPILPSLPLPQLQETMERYLQTVHPLVSNEEWKVTSRKAREFLSLGGSSEQLQRRLQDKSNHPNTRNWLNESYAKVRYLRDRRPLVPFSSYFATHSQHDLGTRVQHSPAVRAAIISWAVSQFKTQYERGELTHEVWNDKPLCIDGYRWLFNACRVPGIEVDQPEKWPSQGFLIAVRNGHFYKIFLELKGRPLTVGQLTGTFDSVIQAADSMAASRVGILTNDNRDIWSKNREALIKLSEDNAASLRDIESADFIVCLDKARPETSEERAYHFWSATELNRWHDKTLQFIVCDNGISGFIGEHSMIDGIITGRLNAHVMQAIQNFSIDQPLTELTHTELIPISFSTNEELEARMDIIPKQLSARLQKFLVKVLDIDLFGVSFVREHRFNPNAFINMVVQLAFYRLYGQSVPTVEAVTTSYFFQGRLDFCRVVTDEVVAFCRSMGQHPRDQDQCYTLFQKAAAKHVSLVAAAGSGKGIDMHFLGLKDMVREGEQMPALFADAAFQYSGNCTVSMMSLAAHASELGVYPLKEDGWRIALLLKEASVRFVVIGQRPRHAELCGLLEQASKDVVTLFKPH